MAAGVFDMSRSFGQAICGICILGALMLPMAALAQTPSSGQEISTAIAGNTIRGSMVASGAFEEFYAPDGQVRGPDYTGAWQVQGNRLCLSYDGDPPSCWSLQIAGSSVIWIGSGGEEGIGTILSGNPRGY